MSIKRLTGSLVILVLTLAMSVLSVNALEPPRPDRHPDASLPSFSASASDHTLLLSYGGTLSSWGRNDRGQCGVPQDILTLTQPNYIDIGVEIKSVSAGGEHSIALDVDGNVWAWGDNTYGQLGCFDITDTYIPTKIEGLENIIQISAGEFHSLALDAEGNVWAWGRNNFYQLGNEENNNPVPQKISGLSNITMIATKFNHNMAVEGDSVLWAWGNNSLGQLGEYSKVEENVGAPIEVPLTRGIKIVKIDTGREHSVALIDFGEGRTVCAWGSNMNHQLGKIGLNWSYAPVRIETGSVADILAGEYRTVFTSGGLTWYCGTGCYYDINPVDTSIYDGEGQMSDYSADVIEVPTAIKADGNVIALGNTHTVSYNYDYLKVWGRNSYGQMLTEDADENLSPTLTYFLDVTPKLTAFPAQAAEQLFLAELNFVELNSEEPDNKNFWLHPLTRNGVTEVNYIDARHFSFKIDPGEVPDSAYPTKRVFLNMPLYVTWHTIKLNYNLTAENWLKMYDIIITISEEEPITLGKEDGAKIIATIKNGTFSDADPANWGIVGAQDSISISEVELIDDKTVKITLSGKSSNVYDRDNNIKLVCKAAGYTDSLDYYTQTATDLESENELVFSRQTRTKSGSGGGTVVTPPTASIKGGTVSAGTKLELRTSYQNGKIYYTTDGSTPNESSTQYTEPIVIDRSMTVRYFMVVNGRKSRVETQSFTVMPPVISIKDGADHLRYIEGYSDKTFRPDQAIARYEMLNALNYLLNMENVDMQQTFTDVPEQYAELVARFAGAGVIDGYSDDEFKGDRGLTRAEFVKVMSVVLDVGQSDEESSFDDVNGHWAESYIADFTKLGYLKGYDDGLFHPDVQITRAEFTAVVNRIIQNNNVPAENVYTDLVDTHWAIDEILKAFI